MADTDLQTAAQDAEQDFSIPGQDSGNFMEMPAGIGPSSPGPSAAPVAPSAPQGMTSDELAQSFRPGQPRITGKAQFFGNLLKTLLSAVQNAPGNPNNAFDRGFMAQSPQAKQMQQMKQQTQQANLAHIQSETDAEKAQTALTGMKALQLKYLLARLPQQLQEQHLETIAKFKDFLVKSGASVEAEADDMKAGDAQAARLNGSDQRSTGHAGRFYNMPSMDEEGKPKWEVVYVPNKDVLQSDWESDDGSIQIKAGTPIGAGFAAVISKMQKGAQDDTKAEHTAMANALKPNVPDSEINQTVEWLKSQQKQNTPLYQQNKNAVDAQINTLTAAQRTTQTQKLQQMRAGAEIRKESKEDELTSSTRTMTEAAPRVIDLVDRVSNLIDQQVKTLGPAASRWNEFMAGKVGAPNPDFTKLRTDVGLLTTLLMRMHVGARGGEYIMKHFQDLIDTGKQSPENLRAALGEIRSYAQDVAKEGGKTVPAAPQQTVPQRPSGVPANAIWNPETRQWRLPQ